MVSDYFRCYSFKARDFLKFCVGVEERSLVLWAGTHAVTCNCCLGVLLVAQSRCVTLVTIIPLFSFHLRHIICWKPCVKTKTNALRYWSHLFG